MINKQDIVIEVFEGNSVTFECPILETSTESLQINWLKHENPINVYNFFIKFY